MGSGALGKQASQKNFSAESIPENWQQTDAPNADNKAVSGHPPLALSFPLLLLLLLLLASSPLLLASPLPNESAAPGRAL